MTEHVDLIPADLVACQELLRAMFQRLRDLERQLEEMAATTGDLTHSYNCLKEEYLALKRQLFGPRRERLAEAPGQQHLFDDAPTAVPVEPLDNGATEQPASRKPRKGHGRRIILDHSPRTPILHDVPPDERLCGCGREKAQIGEDVT